MKILVIYTFVIVCCFSSLSLGKISSCASWNTTGRTIAGNGQSGSGPDQLSYPQGIFIHQASKRLYIADTFNNRIQLYPLNQTITSDDTGISNVEQPFKIYVNDEEGRPTIYIASHQANRVEKWIEGASKGVQVGDVCMACTGVWLDNKKNVYMSESDRQRVLQWSPVTNITTIVAGQTDMVGSTADRLHSPEGIVVDKNSGTVYVADLLNHRIQKWPKDATEGMTIAGWSNGTAGSDAASLWRPYGLRFDEETNIVYVVDLLNNRIQRWLPGASEGDTIAGGNGQGSASNQFYQPTDLAFDSDGNLYVSDGLNHRVQVFSIVDNRPCSSAHKSTISTFALLILSWILVVRIQSEY